MSRMLIVPCAVVFWVSVFKALPCVQSQFVFKEPPTLTTGVYDWNSDGNKRCVSSDGDGFLGESSLASSKQGCADYCAAMSIATALIIIYRPGDPQLTCRCKLDCVQLLDPVNPNVEVFQRSEKTTTTTTTTAKASKPTPRAHVPQTTKTKTGSSWSRSSGSSGSHEEEGVA